MDVHSPTSSTSSSHRTHDIAELTRPDGRTHTGARRAPVVVVVVVVVVEEPYRTTLSRRPNLGWLDRSGDDYLVIMPPGWQ